MVYDDLKKEIKKLKENESQYVWDELEEIITDKFEDELLTSDEFDELMEMLDTVEP